MNKKDANNRADLAVDYWRHNYVSVCFVLQKFNVGYSRFKRRYNLVKTKYERNLA